MLYRLIILTALLSLPVPAFAGSLIDLPSTDWFSDFSKTDYKYQTVSTLVTFADWNQTLQFAENNKYERNVFLGDFPSKSKINTLIPLAIAGQWLVAWALPTEAEIFGLKYNPRRTFQIGVIVGEGWAVAHNYQQLSINVRW